MTLAQANAHNARVAGGKKPIAILPPSLVGSPLVILISGQIRGGKNNMIVTRQGRHFPKPEWAKWRDAKVAEVKNQLPVGFQTLTQPVNLNLSYIAGDKRRRDMPAIIDSIFHVLEKAGVVTDDTLIWVTQSSRSYDKDRPMASLVFRLAESR